MKECTMCRIFDKLESDEKDWLIAELKTGYAVISKRWQYFRGYTLFVCKECVGELDELPLAYRKEHLFEMSVVAEAVNLAFAPSKLNYELLGNDCRHIHWHIIPRYGTDPEPTHAIWTIDREIFDTTWIENDEAALLRDCVRRELLPLMEKYDIKL